MWVLGPQDCGPTSCTLPASAGSLAAPGALQVLTLSSFHTEKEQQAEEGGQRRRGGRGPGLAGRPGPGVSACPTVDSGSGECWAIVLATVGVRCAGHVVAGAGMGQVGTSGQRAAWPWWVPGLVPEAPVMVRERVSACPSPQRYQSVRPLSVHCTSRHVEHRGHVDTWWMVYVNQ